MTAPSRSDAAPQRGFVLVGVIMFMLALTILGLSLFTLSQYEYRFLGDSIDRSQAFYAASGGMEHAKFALLKTEQLSSVRDSLPFQGIVYAVAKQGVAADYSNFSTAESSATIIPDSTIVVRVKARVRANTTSAESVMVEAKYKASSFPFAYKYLMSLFSGATSISLENGASPPAIDATKGRNISLGGNGGNRARLWLNYTNTAPWRSVNGNPTVNPNGTGVPIPPLDQYWTQYWAIANAPVTPGSSHDYHLNAGNGKWDFFKSAHDDPNNIVLGNPNNPNYGLRDSVVNANKPSIAVDGKCVWMFDRGVRFTDRVSIKRSSQAKTSALVIVAKRNTDVNGAAPDTGCAIWFENGIEDNTSGGANNYCPVILVTDGRVRIENRNQAASTSSKLKYLTIFAREVYLQGPGISPVNNGVQMQFFHDQSAPEDQLGGLIDQLSDLGLLPGVTHSASDRVQFITGTWRLLP